MRRSDSSGFFALHWTKKWTKSSAAAGCSRAACTTRRAAAAAAFARASWGVGARGGGPAFEAGRALRVPAVAAERIGVTGAAAVAGAAAAVGAAAGAAAVAAAGA